MLALGWRQVAACVGGEGSQKTLQCGCVVAGGEGEETCQESIQQNGDLLTPTMHTL